MINGLVRCGRPIRCGCKVIGVCLEEQCKEQLSGSMMAKVSVSSRLTEVEKMCSCIKPRLRAAGSGRWQKATGSSLILSKDRRGRKRRMSKNSERTLQDTCSVLSVTWRLASDVRFDELSISVILRHTIPGRTNEEQRSGPTYCSGAHFRISEQTCRSALRQLGEELPSDHAPFLLCTKPDDASRPRLRSPYRASSPASFPVLR